MQLHTYFRSSASYRVRIALNLKGLRVEHVGVHLNRSGGEQFNHSFHSNACSLVKEWPGLPSRRLGHASNSQW